MNICLYGAASDDIDKKYILAVEELGKKMAEHGHGLVFGGGASGSMGAVARGMTLGGGKIVGVVPSFFNVDGILYDKCTELIRTETMRERKTLLDEKSDAFIIAPGGFGTMDEFFEMLTLKQLACHKKAMVIFNINGYYNNLLQFFDNALAENFIKEGSKTLFEVCDNPDDILEYLENYKPIDIDIVNVRKV